MKFKYDPKSANDKVNMVGLHAEKMASSDIDKINFKMADIELLKKESFYIPNFFCLKSDQTIFNNLKSELEENKEFEIVKWSQHYKHENPKFSKTFNEIVDKMAKHFNVDVVETRLNFYLNGQDWKPFHKDSHAYGVTGAGQKVKEDFTMGASFGESREIEFMHEETQKKFKFPQHNGDIFAFSGNVNKKFMHGIPKSYLAKGPRFSIIAWGKRKD